MPVSRVGVVGRCVCVCVWVCSINLVHTEGISNILTHRRNEQMRGGEGRENTEICDPTQFTLGVGCAHIYKNKTKIQEKEK